MHITPRSSSRSLSVAGSSSARSWTSSDLDGSEPAPKRCHLLSVCCGSLWNFLEGFSHAPKSTDFLAVGNFRCAWCIWFVLALLFASTVILQIQHWFQLGADPPIVITKIRNEFWFAPNIEFCSEIPVQGEGIMIDKVETAEAKSSERVLLQNGVDYFPVPDCAAAARLCDMRPPVLCPIPDKYWPIDPDTGKRVRTGSPHSPLTHCTYASMPCTRLFMKPHGRASLPKKEATGKSTELHVTAYREVNPKQWLFESRLMFGRCLVARGTGMQLGADTCKNDIINNDLTSMFQFYAKKGETGEIKERGGNCIQAEKNPRPYATVVPCDFAGSIRFDATHGFLLNEGNPPLCITGGEDRPDEMIKFPWGPGRVTAFKVFWERCADKTTEPDTFSRQTWMFDQGTGLISSSITPPHQKPEAHCLVMSNNPAHWSKQTALLVLLPCRFVRPLPKAANVWWAKAQAALAANTGGGPTMVAVAHMNVSDTEKGYLYSDTKTDHCTVTTQVLPGNKLAGTAEWTCSTKNTACQSDCGVCSPGCDYIDWIGDGNCNPKCNNSACNFDCSDILCDCFEKQAGATTPATKKQAANYRTKVLGAFNQCKESCGSIVHSHAYLLRFRWEAYGPIVAPFGGVFRGAAVRLVDERPSQGCINVTGYTTKPCYTDLFQALNGSPFNGSIGRWCMVGQRAHVGQAPLPYTLAEIIKITKPPPPKAVTMATCQPQLNSQRFEYMKGTGLLRVKGGGCLMLDSSLNCQNIRVVGTPMRSLANISLPGSFTSLEKCSAAVKMARFENFTYRAATGASFVPSTKGCFANMGHVATHSFLPNLEYCHFVTASATPTVVVANCDGTDPRQQFDVTPQMFFAPQVAFSPPQTKPVVGIRLWLRVLYGKLGFKNIVDNVVHTLAKAGFKQLVTTGLFGQEMPLELELPGQRQWEKAGHTQTSRNQLYRISLNPLGYGRRIESSLDMPWSMTGEDMIMQVASSDIVLEKDPVESLRVERIYLRVAYSSEEIVHHIATADLVTALSTLMAVLLASAGLMKCWGHVFPKGDTHHMTLTGHTYMILNEHMAKAGVTPEDVHEWTGIDVNLNDEREPCCPCLFPNEGRHEE